MRDNSALALNPKHTFTSYLITKKDIHDCVDIASLPKVFIDPENKC